MIVILQAEKAIKQKFVTEYAFHPKRKWRFDYALPAYQIAVEIEGGVWSGGRHTRSAGYLRDCEKYNTATAMGWRVLRLPTSEIQRDWHRQLQYIIDTYNLVKAGGVI